MTRAVIAFGANLGDREATIASATRALAGTPGVELVAVSPVYETVAITDAGVDHDAPGYLNGVFVVETSLEPLALLDVLQEIESEHGRVRAEHWGDRTLDLDLIDFGGRSPPTHGSSCRIRGPGSARSCSQPWLDVDPDAVVPGRGAVADLRVAALDEVVRR